MIVIDCEEVFDDFRYYDVDLEKLKQDDFLQKIRAQNLQGSESGVFTK